MMNKTAKANKRSPTTKGNAEPKQSASKKKGINKAILIGTGITATGLLAYFIYKYYLKAKEDNETAATKQSNFIPPAVDTPAQTNYQATAAQSNADTSKSKSSFDIPFIKPKKPKQTGIFPLHKGSKGKEVKQLQEALIAKYGNTILPKYGADGDFGKELAVALKKLNHPSSISESLFHVITEGKQTEQSLALQLYAALNKTDFTKTISLLQQMRNTTDYKVVNTEFKNYRLHGGVRQTLVNGALNNFVDKQQKEAIRLEFLRMGLKYNGKKWSLDGLDGAGTTRIITTKPTQVWLDGYRNMNVPVNMVLGYAMAEKLDFTLFENNSRYFLVRTDSIKQLA